MTDSNYDPQALHKLLGYDVQPLNKVRIVTKRGKHSSRFAEVSEANTAIVDQLANLAENLADEGNGAGAKHIISIIRQLLDNNNKLQQVVNEALQDISG